MSVVSRRLLTIAVAAVGLAFAKQAIAGPFNVTYEAAGVQNTTGTFSYSGVENFDEQATGTGQSFTTNYATTAASAYQVTGSYSGVQINTADQYGGAGGTGNYATTFSSTGYTLNLSSTNTATGQAAPINYFGFWLSALDAGNVVSFYSGNALVYSFAPPQVQALLNNNTDYRGNPNAPYKGDDYGENYVFLNFYDTVGSFDRIVFSQTQGGGYESDNQTVGYFLTETGTAVPEPATIALLGIGVAGLLWLRRRSPARAAARPPAA
jgi:hypothetical protein